MTAVNEFLKIKNQNQNEGPQKIFWIYYSIIDNYSTGTYVGNMVT